MYSDPRACSMPPLPVPRVFRLARYLTGAVSLLVVSILAETGVIRGSAKTDPSAPRRMVVARPDHPGRLSASTAIEPQSAAAVTIPLQASTMAAARWR